VIASSIIKSRRGRLAKRIKRSTIKITARNFRPWGRNQTVRDSSSPPASLCLARRDRAVNAWKFFGLTPDAMRDGMVEATSMQCKSMVLMMKILEWSHCPDTIIALV